MLQKLVNGIVDRILDRVGLEKRLDVLQAQAVAELEETRDKALQTMKEAIPEAAAAMAEATLKSVFDHTQIDESADRVTGVLNNILDQLPFGLGR